mgnify:CR=1 FL=1
MSLGVSFGNVDFALRAALDGLIARQRAIANNVANVDTPGFKGTEVLFERQLQLALNRRQPLRLVTTNPLHLDGQSDVRWTAMPQSIPAGSSAFRNDGNNVDIDREMVKLADTTIKYNATTQLISARLSLLRSIIAEGRR